MTTNKFFKNEYSKRDQKIVDDLIEESIQIHGINAFYLPRSLKNFDQLYETDTVSEYNSNFLIEMYVKDANNYNPPNEFMSKFGIEFKDDITFSVSIRAFEKNVIRYNPEYVRPQESDLIYIPFLNRIFIIKYADYKSSPTFFTFGKNYFYDLKCEVFEYSSEILNTGIEEIDNIQIKYTYDLQDWQILTNDMFFIADQSGYAIVQSEFELSTQDVMEDNDNLNLEANNILDFTEVNPFND